MNLTIYRKYRPIDFKEIVGQNHIKTTLQNELELSKVSHAYLFTGPRGTGKTTMARIFAKAINCQNLEKTKNEPCNKCDYCKDIKEGKELDIIEIDAASNRGIDEIRDLREKVKYSPTRLKYKVYIIDEAHMLTIEAFNALLKTLEEPPQHAIFILVTTEVHKLPATIISRTQRFDFKKINLDDIVQRLNFLTNQEKKSVPKEILLKIAQRSEGCLRDAESLLGQILSLSDKKVTAEQAELIVPKSDLGLIIELIDQLTRNQAGQAISLVNKLVEEGVDLQVFVNDLIEVLRKLMLIKINAELNEFAIDFDQKTETQINELVGSIKISYLINMIERFIATRRELKSAEIIQFPLELAIISLSQNNTEAASVPVNVPNQSQNIKTESNSDKKEVVEKKGGLKIKLSIEQIKEKWEEILICLRKYNLALASALKAGSPYEIKNDTVQLCFKYKFHQERIQDVKNKETLEKVLNEIFGFKVKIQAVTIKDLPKEKVAEIEAELTGQVDTGLDSILQTFGGKIIE